MRKEVVYKIFSYHFKKVILNKKELLEQMKLLESDFEKDNIRRLYEVLDKYKDNQEYVVLDDYAAKSLKVNFGLTKNEISSKILIDGKLYRVFFEYFNEMKDSYHSFDVLKNNQKDLLSRLDFLEIDYGLLIERQKRTLQDIGEEHGYTRERIRQKIKEIKGILIDYTDILNLNYISYEDIKLLPRVKQAIVYANDNSNLESLHMYVFDEKLRNSMKKTMEEFKELLLNEDPSIDLFTEKNYTTIKRYVQNDVGFYMIKDELYTIYDISGIQYSKYLTNYLEENNINKFVTNKSFVEKFKSSIHGQLLEEVSEKKITLKYLKEIISYKKIVKGGTDSYYYSNGMLDKENVEKKLKENLPIKGKEEFENIFEEELNNSNLTVEDLYSYIKVISSKNIKIHKYNIGISQN